MSYLKKVKLPGFGDTDYGALQAAQAKKSKGSWN